MYLELLSFTCNPMPKLGLSFTNTQKAAIKFKFIRTTAQEVISV